MVSYNLLLFCFTIGIPLGSSLLFDDASNLQNLLSLITEEKRMRTTVENEIQSLKTDIAAMKARHQSSK